MRNNITAEWSGDTLVVKNTAGGKVSLTNYAAASNSQVLFDVVDDAQTDGLNEPILWQHRLEICKLKQQPSSLKKESQK